MQGNEYHIPSLYHFARILNRNANQRQLSRIRDKKRPEKIHRELVDHFENVNRANNNKGAKISELITEFTKAIPEIPGGPLTGYNHFRIAIEILKRIKRTHEPANKNT